jgi:hypothetical protein
MTPLLAGLFKKGGEKLVEGVGKILDDVITNKEEKAEIQLKIDQEVHRHLEELSKSTTKEFELEISDKQNARSREVEMAKSGKRDWFMQAVGIFVLLSFAFMCYVSVYLIIPAENREQFLDLRSTIRDAVIAIIFYYFGSSKGSADKTKLLK